MRGAGQWLDALDGQPGRARILFGRLGLVADCRPLTSGELAECLEMGGARGARYALYLACDSLRQAGEQQVLAGQARVAFDITEALPYADVMAAAGIVARLSGAGPARVRLLEPEEDAQAALDSALAEAETSGQPGTAMEPDGAGEEHPFFAAFPALAGARALSWADTEIDQTGQSPARAAPAAASEGAWAAQFGRSAALEGWPGEGAAGRGLPPLQGGIEARGAGGQAGLEADALARILADKLRDAAFNM